MIVKVFQVLPGGVSQKRGLIKKGGKDAIDQGLNLNSFPTSPHFRGQKIGNVPPIKTRSLSAFPWFSTPALCWPLCLCKEAASLKHHRKKQLSPRQWSRLHTGISNIGRQNSQPVAIVAERMWFERAALRDPYPNPSSSQNINPSVPFLRGTNT